MDAEEHRRASAEHWEEAAAGWARRQEAMRAFSAPVSHWMVDAIRPQPGHQVLELAAGIGETGFLAAELVRPGGTLICSDQAEAMLEAARRRAAELQLDNVEFKLINAEWIDLPVASVDSVLCRWGYMLMADPATALRETRRVLRSGGRVALAVWDSAERNPWLREPMEAVIARGHAERTDPDEPGPMALSDPGRLRELLEEAGLEDILIEAVDLEQHHAGFDDFWQAQLDMGRRFHDAVMSLPEGEIELVRAELRERLAPYADPRGALAVPGRTFVASAGA